MSTADRHAPFARIYLHGGLLAAVLGGFPAAAYLGSHLGFGLSLSPALPAIAQAHGQAQILGWLGLFIMGVSLHFLPRLSGAPLVAQSWLAAPGVLVLTAVTARMAAQPARILDPMAAWPPLALGLSGVLLALGVLVYAGLILSCLLHRRIDASTHPTIGSVRPWLLVALLGWLGTGGLFAAGALRAALDGYPLLEPGLQHAAVDLFIGAILVPVAFVFSRQVMPLYLRVAKMPDGRTGLAAIYGMTVVAVTVGHLLSWEALIDAGRLAHAGFVTHLVVALQLHHRRKPLGTDASHTLRQRFGRFEPPIYTAFAALLAAALAQAALAAMRLADLAPPVTEAGVRHLYLAGFGSLLLLGVAPRMLPGFLGARGPAWPALVGLAGGFGAVAVVGVTRSRSGDGVDGHATAMAVRPVRFGWLDRSHAAGGQPGGYRLAEPPMRDQFCPDTMLREPALAPSAQ